ncbi:hypothetical protein KG086_08975 [Lacticaseibacillus chiayiensis]|uniref:hypothetical protein n=1 Tax=Lacticaseibacillus chiayiensis TaxID=2100821 RepID=UPI001BD02F39|nr:hypothetical protein [Lacticaseibacillus chiayiensis]QVI33929.1 hypothetical protein KG086_08975 [Lacticaseibacillus chiayiensis]
MRNPYYIFIIDWVLIIFLYRLQWSSIYPNISLSLYLFLILSCMIAIVLSRLYPKSIDKAVSYAQISLQQQTLYRTFAIFLLTFCFAEGFYSKGFPLFGQVSYQEFGIPVLHVIVQITNTFFSIRLLDLIIRYKFKYMSVNISFCISILSFILQFSRGTIVIVAGSGVFLFLVYHHTSSGIRWYSKFLLTLAIFIGLYFFGVAGDHRLSQGLDGMRGDAQSSLIMQFTSASPEFTMSKIPKPFYWSYLYATSPLANLQETISANAGTKHTSENGLNIETFKPLDYAIRVFTPDIISSHVLQPLDLQPVEIAPQLTVASAFFVPYMYYGFLGMIIYVFVLLIIPLAYVKLVNRIAPTYLPIAHSLMMITMLLTPFDNMIAFSGLSVLFVFPILLGIFTNTENKV